MYKNHVAMAQRTAFNNSPDPASWGSSVAGGGGRMSEKAGAGAGGVMLGPFGTEAGGGNRGNTGSAGRASMDESSGSGLGQGLTPASNLTPRSGPDESSGGGYGGGIYGGGAYPGGRAYGPLSAADENETTEYIGVWGDQVEVRRIAVRRIY